MTTVDLTPEIEADFERWAWSRKNLARMVLIPETINEEVLKAVLLALPWAECPVCCLLHIDTVCRAEDEYQGVCPACFWEVGESMSIKVCGLPASGRWGKW